MIEKFKLIFLISVEFLLIYLIYILKTTPGASGYEASIYAMYPETFWMIYFIIYLFSISIVIYTIFIKYDHLSLYSSLINLIILNLIILLLPLFRDYLSVHLGDCTTHLGYIRDILSTHNIGEHRTRLMNVYPITHILSAIIILFTQIKLETIGQIIPVYYYFIYVSFVYLLGKILYKKPFFKKESFTKEKSYNKKSILLLLFLFVPLLPSPFYCQSVIFFNCIPILLYTFIKDITSENKSNSFRYLIVILIVVFPLLHPASSILLMLLFTIICIAGYCTDTKNFTLTLKSYKTTPLLFIVIWLLWTTSLKSQFESWIGYYKNFILYFSVSEDFYDYYSAGLQEAGLPIIEAIDLYIRLFGPTHLLFGMAFVISLYTIYKWIKKKDTDNKLNTILSLISLIYITLYVISFFKTVGFLGSRLGPFVLLISIFVNVNYLFNLVNASKTKIKKIVSLILIIILLFSITYIASFSLYNSPIVKKGPGHGTYMAVDGMNWLFQTRTDYLSIEELGYTQYNIAKFIFGDRGRDREKSLSNLRTHRHSYRTPYHFNYTNECLLAKSFKDDCYLYINKKTELFSVIVFPEYEHKWKFTPDDYKKLEYDRSIDKIYHNSEIRIFYVNGRRYK